MTAFSIVEALIGATGTKYVSRISAGSRREISALSELLVLGKEQAQGSSVF
jgi:hypothetical protein